MRVLFLSTRDIVGGAAKAAYRLLCALQEMIVEARMDVLSKTSDNTSVEVLEPHQKSGVIGKYYDKIIARIYKYLSNYNNSRRTAEQRAVTPYQLYLGNLLAGKKGSSLHKNNSFDVLHIHWVDGFIDFAKLKELNKPIVMTLHDCSFFTGGCPHFGMCKLYKTSCNAASCALVGTPMVRPLLSCYMKRKEAFVKSNPQLHIVAPSTWMAERARESALLQGVKVSVIPNGLDTNMFQPQDRLGACNHWNLSPDKQYILFGAANALRDPNKGWNLLQRSIQLFAEQYSHDNVELVIFGANEAVNMDNVALPVKSVGYVQSEEDLALLYAAASIMVVPSLYENLPQTAVEAMSCGTPVVAFHTSGLVDIVDHQQNGYLAECYNPQELAEGIHWCLMHNANGELSKHARKKSLRCFSENVVTRQYVELYKTLIDKYNE